MRVLLPAARTIAAVSLNAVPPVFSPSFAAMTDRDEHRLHRPPTRRTRESAAHYPARTRTWNARTKTWCVTVYTTGQFMPAGPRADRDLAVSLCRSLEPPDVERVAAVDSQPRPERCAAKCNAHCLPLPSMRKDRLAPGVTNCSRNCLAHNGFG